MRRIIERVVTVVTTTTWTISWQDDTSHASGNFQSDSVTDNIPEPDFSRATAKHIQKFSPVIQTQEAEPAETKAETDPMADEPLLNPNSYPSKIERNKIP